MTPADRPHFAEMLAALAASFGREADEAMAQGYWMGLADLELHEVEAACARAIRESEFFPKPVELRRLAGHMVADMRAVLAFDAVTKAIGRYGYVTSVCFDDALANAAVRSMGGWERLCMMPSEEYQVWGRKEFERVYAALCEGGSSEEACAYLPGWIERKNGAAGYHVDPPTVVACGLPPHKSNVMRLSQGGDVDRLVRALASKRSG